MDTRDAVEVKLFIGRLPRTMDENAVRPLFEEFGRVVEVAIIRDKATQVHKGSAFVRMASLKQADAAIRSLNNVKTLDPQMGPLQVRYAVGEAEKLGIANDTNAVTGDQAKLFVGSIPKAMSEDEVRTLFGRYGTIDEVYLMKDNLTGEGKGCAFIKFAYKEHAMQAIKSLNANITIPGAPRPIEVRFAEAKRPGTVGPIPSTSCAPAVAAASAQFPGTAQPKPIVNKNLNPRLAGNWQEFFNTEGRPYYHNEKENKTQWERPPEYDVTTLREACIPGPPGANLLVSNLPMTWTDRDLATLFRTFGKLTSCKVFIDPVTGRSLGYGHISFDSVVPAAASFHAMHGWTTESKTLKMSIRNNEDDHITPSIYSHLKNGSLDEMWIALLFFRVTESHILCVDEVPPD